MKENNKLIAEFMGFKPCLTSDPNGNKIYVGTETPFGWQYPDCYPEHDYLISVEDLKFNTSWDWLMPVVQKIGDEYYNTPFNKLNNEVNIWTLEDTYNAVVEFIKEYSDGKDK